MNLLKEVTIKGFKSIESLVGLDLGDINIMIGPNGAGKTNLISFFKMVSFAINSPDDFQEKYITKQGKAPGLLFQGSHITQNILGELVMESEKGTNYYYFNLVSPGGIDLYFSTEKVKFDKKGLTPRKRTEGWINLLHTTSETSVLKNKSTGRPDEVNATIKTISYLLSQIKTYQFHDTSSESSLRRAWSLTDGAYLKDNGQNLAAYLYNLKHNDNQLYARIVSYIQRIIPNFDNFVLEPYGHLIELRWLEKGSEYVVRSSQASDGTLRFMCLVTLLVNRPEGYPTIIFIDEPELGLHPDAIVFIAELLKKASVHCQVFVSTQSPKLVDQFEASDIIVVERKERASTYKRLENHELETWLESYDGLGDIWQANIIGGKP